MDSNVYLGHDKCNVSTSEEGFFYIKCWNNWLTVWRKRVNYLTPSIINEQ